MTNYDANDTNAYYPGQHNAAYTARHSAAYSPTTYSSTAAPRKRRVWPWVLGAVALAVTLCGGAAVALLGAGTEAVSEQIEHGSVDLESHVKITGCKRDQLGFAQIDYTVTNTSDSTQTYWIQFAVKDRDGVRLSEAHGIVNNLAPGATAKDTAIGVDQTKSLATCELERIN